MVPMSTSPDLPHDTGYAPPKWAFDDEVTRVFEEMLWRSIPGYAVMRDLCAGIARRALRPRGTLVDLGCSRGGAIAAVLSKVDRAHEVRAIGAEISPPMVAAARARFDGDPLVRIDEVDLRVDFPVVGDVDVVLAVLTLQFVPIEHRARVVRRAAEALSPGGAMVVVEKILGSTSWGDGLLVDDYYDFKRSNGYTQDDIDRKRLALEGVLVPLTAAANVDMLRSEGFRDVQQFWQHLNFAGWVARR